MLRNKRYFILLTFITFFSCEKEIDLKIDEDEQRLVLNSWMFEGENPWVEVTTSRFIFSDDQVNSVQNATVNLYENEEFIGTLSHVSDGNYTADYELKGEGTHYSVEVVHNNFESIQAESSMPKSFQDQAYELTVGNYEEVYYDEYWSDWTTEVGLEVKDKTAMADYVLINIYAIQKYYHDQMQDTVYYRFSVYYNFPEYQNVSTVRSADSDYLLIDQTAQNLTSFQYNFTVQEDLRKTVSNEDDVYVELAYTVELIAINKDLYLYLKSREANRYPDPFTEPTQVYSNVENGYGILGLSIKTAFEITEEKEEDDQD